MESIQSVNVSYTQTNPQITENSQKPKQENTTQPKQSDAKVIDITG